MAGGWLGSWGWGMWACQTGEREEVVGVCLLLRRLKPFGRPKIFFKFLNYFLP